jgi:hypothetical protein
MAPPRRVRDEALTLRRPGSPDIELFRARESIYVGQYPTQGRFQVTPDAHAVAFTTPGQSTLTIVRRDGTMTAFDGVHHDQFRISPDGHALSVARHNGTFGMSRIDLKTMQLSAWGWLRSATWSEFCADGLMVLEYTYGSPGENSLKLLPWNGEPRVIARIDNAVNRFACAKAASSIAYFAVGKVWLVPQPGAEAVLLADLGEQIVNSEMAPDGRSIIAVTKKDAYLFEDGKLVGAIGVPHAHTVWFSRDGSQFVVANSEKAHWQRGAKKFTLIADEDAPIRTARFAPGSPWIMVARGREAIRWNPEREEAVAIASVDGDQEVLGVDVFGGGVVLWTGTTWKLEDRRGRG